MRNPASDPKTRKRDERLWKEAQAIAEVDGRRGDVQYVLQIFTDLRNRQGGNKAGQSKRRTHNPPPRLEFRPPDPREIFIRTQHETEEHFPGTPGTPFSLEEIENFVNYVDLAFKSVPPEIFEYRPATIYLSGPVELPGVFQFNHKIDCWWMKDPVALCVGYHWDGINVEFAYIEVRSWQAFTSHLWRGSYEVAASAPYGLQIAAIEIPWPFSTYEKTNKKQYWEILEESTNLIDELESTGQWKVSSTGQPLRLPSEFPMQKILYDGEYHPGQVGDVRDMGLTSLSIDIWGRGHGLNDDDDDDNNDDAGDSGGGFGEGWG